jgi:hypothetical protein
MVLFPLVTRILRFSSAVSDQIEALLSSADFQVVLEDRGTKSYSGAFPGKAAYGPEHMSPNTVRVREDVWVPDTGKRVSSEQGSQQWASQACRGCLGRVESDPTLSPQVIYMARNPKDLVVSYYQFHRSLRTMSYRGTFQEFCRRFMNDKCKCFCLQSHGSHGNLQLGLHSPQDMETLPLGVIALVQNPRVGLWQSRSTELQVSTLHPKRSLVEPLSFLPALNKGRVETRNPEAQRHCC